MSLNEHGETPDGGFVHMAPLPPIHVPLGEVAEHPLLRRVRIVGGVLIWPGLNSDQLDAVKGIRLYEEQGWVSLPPRVNLDSFVDNDTDEEAPPFWKGRANDLQRYYTRFSDSQFLHIGTFTAITIDDVRRYFMWLPEGWKEIGLGSFLYYRDHGDTHFAETNRDDIAQLSPGAPEAKPARAGDADQADGDGTEATPDADSPPRIWMEQGVVRASGDFTLNEFFDAVEGMKAEDKP